MMYYIGAAFVISVFTYYTLYRYIFQKTELSHDMVSIQVKWQIYYLTYTVLVIWVSSLVKREVSSSVVLIVYSVFKGDISF